MLETYPAAAAGRHAGGVRSHEEPERNQQYVVDVKIRAEAQVLGSRRILVTQALIAIATLVLISLGLAVIFGMMRVINLAHGEFLMLGGYSAIVAYQARRQPLARDAGGRAARGRA